MNKILLVDDTKSYLADILTELKLAGCEVEYCTDIPKALESISSFAPNMVVMALQNSLAYPKFRKIKAALNKKIRLIAYSDNEKSSLREWAYKQDVDKFFSHPFERSELLKYGKKTLLGRNVHFNHHQLLTLTKALAKYTNQADSFVQKHAASSKSLQELEHKLARCLTNFEDQKRFLRQVQDPNQSSIAS